MKFTVNWTLKHNGKRYEAGDEIELTAEQAETLGDVVTAVAEQPMPPDPEPDEAEGADEEPQPEPEPESEALPEAVVAEAQEQAAEPAPATTKATSKKGK